MRSDPRPSEFDEFANSYDEALKKGLEVSGENKDFFAKGRIDFLAEIFGELNFRPKKALDFGCGTGSSVPFLLKLSSVEFVAGVDVSQKSIEIAKEEHRTSRSEFLTLEEFEAKDEFDLVFCNGVFHHIPVDQRKGSLQVIADALRPGGLFALWENNPWNPGTRYVMSRIEFDRDAVTLNIPEAKRLIVESGLEVVRTASRFYFPRILSWLRWSEDWLSRLPLGAQYVVVARKPSA